VADYIRGSILSQAYIHVEVSDSLSETELEIIKSEIAEYARQRADFFLYPDSEILIEFEEGSLKSRITLLGSIAVIIQGVSAYPDFREGVRLLYNDSKRLAEIINYESLFKTNAKHDNLMRMEARTGVAGSLHMICNRIESITNGAKSGNKASSLSASLIKLISEIDTLIAQLEDTTDIQLVKKELKKLCTKIPLKPQPRPRPQPPHEPDALFSYSNRRQEVLNLL